MEISKLQFNVLLNLINSSEEFLRDYPNISKDETASIVSELIEQKLIDNNLKVTKLGFQVMEPYRVKRVIFLAAGFGSRLRPATLNVPKPMVRVHGRPIISFAIEAALAAGIEEIYIVRGYLGECFEQLLKIYPQIHLIDNPDYQTCNNISSAMQVRHLMQNAYVMEADLLINNPAIFQKYHYTSNCLGVPVEKTDDWCVISENGVAKALVQGGENCHHLFSIYYLNSKDGAKIPQQLEEMFNCEDGHNMFWDMVPMNRYNSEYHIEVRECCFDDISEIDTYQELQELDNEYIVSTNT